MSNKIFKSVLIVGTLIILSSQAYGWEKGPWEITPSMKVEERWDSNIYYDKDNEKDDLITILTPGIVGKYKFGTEDKHQLLMSYFCEAGLFSTYHSQNYANHDVFGALKLDFNKYTVDMDNRFQFTSDRAGTEFDSRIWRKIDTFNTVFGTHYNKVDFDLGYQFYVVDYLSKALESIDRYENSGWITGYVQIMPKTKFLAEFMYTNIQYPQGDTRNANAYRFMVGLKGEMSPKVTGIIKVGYKIKDYESGSDCRDFSNPVAYVALVYTPIERLNIVLSYERDGYESIYENNNFYTGDHFMVDVIYRFAKSFLAKLNFSYFYNHYPEVGVLEGERRQDHIFQVGPRLEYYHKDWMVLGLGYALQKRQSNISDRNFTQHIVNGDVTLKY